MVKFNWLILIAVLVGGLVPIQSSINAFLGGYMKTPLAATFINFLGGTIIVAIIVAVLFRNQVPSIAELKLIPGYLFLGGILGATFVTTIVMLTPRIGVTNMLVGAMVGQIVISILFDHFGWMNLTPQPISWQRLVGVIFLIIGVLLTQK